MLLGASVGWFPAAGAAWRKDVLEAGGAGRFSGGYQLLGGVGGDPGHRGLGQRVTSGALGLSAVPAADSTEDSADAAAHTGAGEKLAEQAGGLLVQAGGHVGELLRVLVGGAVVVVAVLPLRRGVLVQLGAELAALAGVHPGEGLLRGVAVGARVDLAGDLVVPAGDLLVVVAFVWLSLVVPVGEVLVVGPAVTAAGELVEQTHGRCPSVQGLV